MTLSEELAWRGFVNQTTFKDVTALDAGPITFYWGVDPSSDSMTIGNLAAAMMVGHFMKHGHKAILLVGGATGLIGDPDGKSEERSLQTQEQIEKNKHAIAAQYSTVFAGQEFEVVDNYDWFKDINYLTFLRDFGKHVPMRQMLGREFVQSRLKEDGAGISYAEFSYSLIQGYDFLHLYRDKSVTLQLCGADQWGNSIAGVDLIRRITGGEAHIWSTPLIINKSTGVKFGKTEEGAIWLDETKTSVFKFYQFWINVDDEGVEGYIKVYTNLGKDEVDSIMSEHKNDPSKRIAQKRLALEVTGIVHGLERARSTERLSNVLFSGATELLSGDEVALAEKELPVVEIKEQLPSMNQILQSSLGISSSEARRALQEKSVYIDGKQLDAEVSSLTEDDLQKGYTIVRRGKNKTVLVVDKRG
jgi:tyrosyl-tRNA synthetase